MDSLYVCDIETKGLLPDLKGEESELHVLGVGYKKEDGSWDIATTKKRVSVQKVFSNPNNIVVGHNFYLYDIPALEKMFKGIDIKCFVVDTLFLSWYLFSERKIHGLDEWGKFFKIKKPEISSWTDLTYEEYEHRVKEDVKINTNLWLYQYKKLKDLYKDDKKIMSFLKFLMCSGKVYKMQQDYPFKLDVENCKKNKELFEGMIQEIVEILSTVMPKIPVYRTHKKPANLYKKDGTLSTRGAKWKEIAEKCNKTIEYEGEIKELYSYKSPNPQSVSQVKDWLFSLNWKPEIYTDSVSVTGEVKQVPQIKDKNKNLCKSVLKLAEKHPEIKHLEKLSLLQHRLGYFKGFLRDMNKDGTITASLNGLANSLRIRHKTLVNLIKPSAPYGEYVRSLLLPPDGMVLIGSDLSALESVTRNNFVYDIDRKFVEDQSHPYYDPHLEICQIAGTMTDAEVIFYKWWKEKRKNPDIKFEEVGDVPEDFNELLSKLDTDEKKTEYHDKLDKKRSVSKVVNYSCMYNVGSKTLSKNTGMTEREAMKMIDAYWEKNNCIKIFTESCEIVTVKDEEWVVNPLNGYKYKLRNRKDIFSIVNQSAGSYIFNLWQNNMMNLGIKLCGSFHDEIVTYCKPEEVDDVVAKLKKAIDMVNRQLKLKVPVGIDYKVGKNYAEVH